MKAQAKIPKPLRACLLLAAPLADGGVNGLKDAVSCLNNGYHFGIKPPSSEREERLIRLKVYLQAEATMDIIE